MVTGDSPFSAADSALGYLFQCRYALLESLRRYRNGDDYLVSIETLDDVVFDTQGQSLAVLQTKHHFKRPGSLSDASTDLWKTLRIWCEGTLAGQMPSGTLFYLITTAAAPKGPRHRD